MKKLLILSAILVSGVAANAQTPTSDHKDASIGVVVSDVRTIAITNGALANFLLDDADAFNDAATNTGLAAENTTELKVVSRAGYTVKAGLKGDLTTDALGNGSKTIPGTAIGINVVSNPVVSSGENPATANTTLRKFTAGSSAASPSEITELVTTGVDDGGTRGTTFDVKYTMSNFPGVVNLAQGSFTSTVVYTIEGL